MPGAAVVALSPPSAKGGRGVSTPGGCWGASVGVGGTGSTRPVALGRACGGLGISAAVAVVVVVSASVVVGATAVGGPVGVGVLATVIRKEDVAGGSVGLEVILVGAGNKIYFLVT